jgi:hypothetical protein
MRENGQWRCWAFLLLLGWAGCFFRLNGEWEKRQAEVVGWARKHRVREREKKTFFFLSKSSC